MSALVPGMSLLLSCPLYQQSIAEDAILSILGLLNFGKEVNKGLFGVDKALQG